MKKRFSFGYSEGCIDFTKVYPEDYAEMLRAVGVVCDDSLTDKAYKIAYKKLKKIVRRALSRAKKDRI